MIYVNPSHCWCGVPPLVPCVFPILLEKHQWQQRDSADSLNYFLEDSCTTNLWCRMAFWLPWSQPLPRKQCRSSQVNRILHNQTSEVKHKMHHVLLHSQLKSVIRMQICKTRQLLQSCFQHILCKGFRVIYITRFCMLVSPWDPDIKSIKCLFVLQANIKSFL